MTVVVIVSGSLEWISDFSVAAVSDSLEWISGCFVVAVSVCKQGIWKKMILTDKFKWVPDEVLSIGKTCQY